MKRRLIGFGFLCGVAVASVSAQPASPSLAIRALANHKVIVSWPDSAAGLQLEQSLAFTPAGVWRPEDQIPDHGGWMMVRIAVFWSCRDFLERLLRKPAYFV